VKIDPGTHQGMHSVLALKLGVTLFYVQVRIFLLSAMPMRAASGKTRPIWARLCTGTCRRTSSDEGILLEGEENVLTLREIASAKH
jgi:hypothetical protein